MTGIFRRSLLRPIAVAVYCARMHDNSVTTGATQALRRGVLVVLAAALLLAIGPGDAEAARKARRAKRPAVAVKAKARPLDLVWHVETLSGDVLETRAGDGPINPASVTKVATTLWALERLGPGHRFTTRLLSSSAAAPVRGELAGDLLVDGNGDPDFQTENALLLAHELNRAGVTRVRGALVVNHAFWMGWEGGSAHREMDPVKRALVMGARLRQAFDPQRWNGGLRQAWRELAIRRGFDVAHPPRVTFGSPTAQSRHVVGEPLVEHRSRPLAEILRRLNCFSNNDIERVGASLGTAEDMGR